MNLNLVWIEDPSSNKPSVSLTLLCVSFLGCIIGGALQISGKIENTSICLELFYGCTALYFGRKVTIGGKTFDGSGISQQTVVAQVEKSLEGKQ